MNSTFSDVPKFIPARTIMISPLAAVLLVATALSITSASTFAQKNKKGQTKQSTPAPVVAQPDAAAIDTTISEMLGAWQLGDVERMHTYYADDALVVSDGWEAPISGWASYQAAYQTQRAHIQSVRMERTNTAIKISGDSAWATYQWEFSGMVDNSPARARGHSTLVFAKRDGHWLIVLNHTSLAQENAQPAPAKSGTP
jgi:uncharacterized protein (TIGR02246 family)